jgi:hypothetical protein
LALGQAPFLIPVAKQKAGHKSFAPRSCFGLEKCSVRIHQLLIGKNGFKPPRFVLIVKHHNGNHAQRSFAGMALRDFALQILQEAIREMI